MLAEVGDDVAGKFLMSTSEDSVDESDLSYKQQVVETAPAHHQSGGLVVQSNLMALQQP